MDENSDRRVSPLGSVLLFLFAIVLPLGLGIYLAPRVVPAPKVGIIRLYYDINPATAQEFKAQLETARSDPSIRSVVVVIDSPGGTASDSEEIFLDMLATRREMPVVATVDFLAASGAYYIAVGAEEIYAKTGSAIGSIGVIGVLPGPSFIEDDVYTTGPFKSSAFTRDARARQVETLKFSFLNAVSTGRGDRLQVDEDFLSRAEIYNGVQAVQYGMIDGVISTEEAIARAAELAGLRSYETVELFELTFLSDEEDTQNRYQPPVVDQERLWAMPTDLAPGMYYRYMVLADNR